MAKKRKQVVLNKEASAVDAVLPKPRASVDKSHATILPKPRYSTAEFVTHSELSIAAMKEFAQIEAIAPERLLARLWNVIDSNNNGVIERHEIAYSGVEAVLDAGEGGSGEMWKGLDANGDGK